MEGKLHLHRFYRSTCFLHASYLLSSAIPCHFFPFTCFSSFPKILFLRLSFTLSPAAGVGFGRLKCLFSNAFAFDFCQTISFKLTVLSSKVRQVIFDQRTKKKYIYIKNKIKIKLFKHSLNSSWFPVKTLMSGS